MTCTGGKRCRETPQAHDCKSVGAQSNPLFAQDADIADQPGINLSRVSPHSVMISDSNPSAAVR